MLICFKRVYFGNWLRDYSQAVDVGTVKNVSAEAIRLLLWVLGFMSFGYGTGEFEVTRDRLGCYRPEEHIDNPKDYADNLDARQYDRRLRGPVDERRELSIDERTGLKHYIATEDIGITTSAAMVRDLYGRCIQLGRRYNRNGNKADFYEALRLLGTANHCLEDYSAHSNYTELALIELGERNVFPHVGRRTQIQLRGARGPVYPLVTGEFLRNALSAPWMWLDIILAAAMSRLRRWCITPFKEQLADNIYYRYIRRRRLPSLRNGRAQ